MSCCVTQSASKSGVSASHCASAMVESSGILDDFDIPNCLSAFFRLGKHNAQSSCDKVAKWTYFPVRSTDSGPTPSAASSTTCSVQILEQGSAICHHSQWNVRSNARLIGSPAVMWQKLRFPRNLDEVHKEYDLGLRLPARALL